MNEYLSGFILGLVQGLTEFLPVSSSGHLILLETLGVGANDLFFNLVLHLSTLLAVIIALRKPLWELIKHPLSEKTRFILIATIPTAVMAGIIRYLLPVGAEWLPLCFITTSVILLLPSIIRPKIWSFGEKGSVKRAVFVGLAQGVACINGISRSGTTVCALNLCGLPAEESAESSFLLGIPIIIGSTVAEGLGTGVSSLGGGLIIGAVTAFVVGLAAIFVFMKIIKKRRLWIFSIYTFLMGILSFILL